MCYGRKSNSECHVDVDESWRMLHGFKEAQCIISPVFLKVRSVSENIFISASIEYIEEKNDILTSTVKRSGFQFLHRMKHTVADFRDDQQYRRFLR